MLCTLPLRCSVGRPFESEDAFRFLATPRGAFCALSPDEKFLSGREASGEGAADLSLPFLYRFYTTS